MGKKLLLYMWLYTQNKSLLAISSAMLEAKAIDLRSKFHETVLLLLTADGCRNIKRAPRSTPFKLELTHIITKIAVSEDTIRKKQGFRGN